MEYLVDGSGSMTLEQMQSAQGWKPHQGLLTLGFVRHPVWLKVRLQPQQAGQGLTIRVGAAYLDDVELFRPLPEGGYSSALAGDSRPYNEREKPDRLFRFDWKPTPAQIEQPLFLRVKSTSSITVQFDVQSSDDLDEQLEVEQLLLGTYVGVIGVVILWSLAHFLIFRDWVSGAMVLFQMAALAMCTGLLGFAAMILFPDSGLTDGFTSQMLLLATLTGAVFHRALLRELPLHRIARTALDVIVVITVVNLLVLMAGFTREALQTNVLMVMLVMLVIMAALAHTFLHSRDRRLRFVTIAYGALAAFIAVSTSPTLGGVSLGRYTLMMPALHAVFTALVLGALLLMRRLHQQQVAAEQIQIAAEARAREESMRDQRNEKEHFLAMLAHELRTPLSVVRMVLDGDFGQDQSPVMARRVQQARRAAREIDAIIERTVQVDQLDRGDLQQQSSLCDMRAIAAVICSDHPMGSRIESHINPELPEVQSDPVLAKTVLQNLLDNALKYSPPSSLVQLRGEPQQRGQRPGVLLQVVNEVHLAGPPDPELLFNKYYRSPGAHRHSGSGLGLYLSSGLARQLGGELQLKREGPANEVCFEFWLPA